jgi:hypothetical protein
MQETTQYFVLLFFINRSLVFILLPKFYCRHLGVTISGTYWTWIRNLSVSGSNSHLRFVIQPDPDPLRETVFSKGCEFPKNTKCSSECTGNADNSYIFLLKRNEMVFVYDRMISAHVLSSVAHLHMWVWGSGFSTLLHVSTQEKTCSYNLLNPVKSPSNH